MHPLLDELTRQAGDLVALSDPTGELYVRVRRLVAACLVQANPRWPALVRGTEDDAFLEQIALEGVQLAAEWDQQGIRAHWAREPYLDPRPPSPRRTDETMGPFAAEDLSLTQVSIHRGVDLLPVVSRRGILFSTIEQTELLLPAGTTPHPERRGSWQIPEGTVRIRARLLSPGASGYVGLRVSSGTFRVGAPPLSLSPLVVPAGSAWVLSVVPEQPHPDAGSMVGARATVTLPERLDVHGDDSPPTLSGSLTMSGFGTDLSFDVPLGAPVIEDGRLCFPFAPAGATWAPPGSGTTVLHFGSTSPAPVASASWALPLAPDAGPADGPALHGGSLQFRLGTSAEASDSPVSTLASAPGLAVGTCRWTDMRITADAEGVEADSVRPWSTLSLETRLWRDTRSQLSFGEPDSIRYVSRHGGGELVRLEGGRVENQWDLPRAASGRPIPYAGDSTTLTVVAEPDGLFRVACGSAIARRPQAAMGFALPNLYLHVWPPTRMAFVGGGDEAGVLTSGRAWLPLDVRLAQPMLPRPYAASWQISDLGDRIHPEALGVVMVWHDGSNPRVEASLADQVPLPLPGWTEDPPERTEGARRDFHRQYGIDSAHLSLLDLSPRGHRLGVRLEPPEPAPRLADNLLTWPLTKARLLMEPQVHWEPVQVLANPATNDRAERLTFTDDGGPTLVTATTVRLVPALPDSVAPEIVAAHRSLQEAGALFGLPFGLQAHVSLSPNRHADATAVDVELHRDVPLDRTDSGYVAATTFLRLRANGLDEGGPDDVSRTMPGRLSQVQNLFPPVANPQLRSILREEVRTVVETTFALRVPLHAADLSGYGLSTFSRWRRALPAPPAKEGTGVSQVRFDVLVGRTSYEVIELQSRLWPPQARVSRTVIVERGNHGRVERFDSGWVAMENGECRRYAPIDTGVVSEYRNIRNIRILDSAPIRFTHPPQQRRWEWQRVAFDADLQLVPDPEENPAGISTAIRSHEGYVQILPVDVVGAAGNESTLPDAGVLAALMDAIGHPVGGPLDATVDLAGTLRMHLTHLEVAHAPGAGEPRFVLAVHGTPALPRAGQWTAVRIDGDTEGVTAVPPHRGVPVVRHRNETGFTFRDAADVYRAAPAAHYGFLMATDDTRVLFPRPVVEPALRTVLSSAPPILADPYALSRASGLFPHPDDALRCLEVPEFAVAAPGAWTLLNGPFSFTPPSPDLAQGADWLLKRQFPGNPLVNLGLDAFDAATPWRIELPEPDDLEVWLAGEHLFSIRSALSAAGGQAAALSNPALLLGPLLKQIKDLVDVLEHFVDLGLDLDVDVQAGDGPTPSFAVVVGLRLRVPGGVNERVDIGIGKLRGQFGIEGRFEAELGGSSRGQLGIELYGDLQQGIIPPLIYAGGHFRFVARITSDGGSQIELGFGAIASVGGALIPKLVELEATVRYGYTLIPETLTPGVQLALEARAKLAAGLLGLSFSADVLARVARLEVEDPAITIWAELRVAATVQAAYVIEEDFELHTQFVQRIPAEAFALLAGVNPLAVVAASEIL